MKPLASLAGLPRPAAAPRRGAGLRALAAALAFSVALALGVACIGCGPGKDAPSAPPPDALPPQITAVHPPARAEGVWYGTGIWAEFAQPLDPATVNARSVFLKVDTEREDADVRYDSATRRILVAAREPLRLRRTYTVEITPGVRVAGGGGLDDTFFWQFTTNSLRSPDPPDPPAGVANRSPVTPLFWNPTESSAGSVLYAVHASVDSAVVAARATPPLATTNRTPLLPKARWSEGVRWYWAVTAENRETGERLDGPVWSFETVPADTPTDSISLGIQWWGVYYVSQNRVVCNGSSVTSSPSTYLAAVRWPIESIARDAQIADVAMRFQYGSSNNPAVAQPSIWAITAPAVECQMGNPGPPWVDEPLGPLATYAEDPGGVRQLYFRSNPLSAHIQGAVGHGGLHGYVFRSNTSTSYSQPELRVRIYRLPQGATSGR